MAGLKPTRFAVKLFNKRPKTLADVMKLAYEAMEVEDMLEEKFREQRAQKVLTLGMLEELLFQVTNFRV